MKQKSSFSTQDIPGQPGVYVFRNSAGDVIYVGKAKNLRKRMASYFQPSRRRTQDIKLRSLINSIEYFECYPVKSESEAFLLESRLVKQYSPRYNVELRDDKRYLLVCVDPHEPYPRLRLTRLKKDDGRIYIGPFPHAGVLRRTINFLARRFGLRTCSPRTPDAATRQHCLERAFRSCSRPCVGGCSAEEYDARLRQALRVLEGATEEIEEELKQDMQQLAEKEKFEEAARVRDMLENLRAVGKAGRMRSFERATLRTRASVNSLEDVQRTLGLADLPHVVECFDISNIGGLMAVGSMVCFRDGKPSRKDYRRYRVRTVEGSNDFAMMREVVTRRYRRVHDEGRRLPDLVVIDGGVGQLNAVIQGLADEGIPPLPVLGLAKRQEEIYLPGCGDPLQLEPHDPARKFLQAVRDEAHRFALAYHHTLRRRRISNSVLTEIEGIGPRRREELLRVFGSVKRLREASEEEIRTKVPGLGPKLTRTLVDFLKQHSS